METKTYLYYSETVRLGQKFEKEVMEDPSQEWRAVVEVSQRHVSYLRTFFRLQHIIDMKHPDRSVKRIKYNNDQQVFSFYFRNLPCAISFARLINRKLPVKSLSDKFPLHIKVCDNRYAFSLQIVPICCADLIILPSNYNVADIGPIVICTKVATTITLLDPLTLRQCYLDAGQYWRKAPFTPSFTRSQLVEYVIIDIVLEDEENNGYRLADVEVARAKDFGNNDFTVRVKTHLGHVLKSGDFVLGYDLFEGAKTNIDFNGDLPAAVLIKKIRNYEDYSGNCEVVVQDKWESDYQLFIDSLYKDPHLAFNIASNCQPYEDLQVMRDRFRFEELLAE